VSIDGQTVDDPNAFEYRFATKPLGGSAHLAVLRAGREATLTVPLRTAPATPLDEIVIKARSPFMGAKVVNISPALADELRLDAAAGGVIVTEVASGSPAENYGFQRGDLIVSVNDKAIEKTQDLDRITRAGGRVWRVTIQRGGQRISAVFSG
jgi:S1-C subfamily serine protease